jgi:prepilin-type N-terminal cleavage/methylation domain-containing protein
MSGGATKRGLRLFRGGEQGVTLIETLVALAILGATAVVFLVGLTTSSKAVMISQERVAADSLAKSQMEYIKSQKTYIPEEDYDPSDSYKSYQLINIPSDLIEQGYAIVINPPEDISEADANIQKITVIVTHDGDEVFRLVNYKVNR